MLKISKLSVKDYCHEWKISGCYVFSLATVLGPILVLFGLKFGIVGNMINELVEDPRNRELRPVTSGRYDRDWFSKLLKRPDIGFVVPRTRNISTIIQLKSNTAGSILNVELIPTALNDPLLANVDNLASKYDSLILSKQAAKKLAVQPGDVIDGSIARRFRGQSDRVHLPLKVLSIAPSRAFNRHGAFCSVPLLKAIENYRDGREVPALGWVGDPPEDKTYYTGFRLYARSINDVSTIEEWLNEQGIDVNTRSGDIEIVQRMDRNFSTMFWMIVVVGFVGCALSLGASLWANIDRKRKEISVLRLVGFGTPDIVWFPIVQSLITALLGWGSAVVIYTLISLVINRMMMGEVEAGKEVCALLYSHYAMSLALTCITTVIAAFAAGLRASRLEPAEEINRT